MIGMIRTTLSLRNGLAHVKIVRSFACTNIIRSSIIRCLHRKHQQRVQSRNTLRLITVPWQQQLRFYADFPEHIRVAFPAFSPTMEVGTIIEWHKKEGDKLEEGDLLAEIETDKATMGFDTPEEGYLAKILLPAGTKDIPIGQLIAIIVQDEKDIEAFKDFVDVPEIAPPIVDVPPPPVTPPEVTPPITLPELIPIPVIPEVKPSVEFPDHIKVAFPAFSPTMEVGTLIEWHKKEGDILEEGDLLAEIETDKATMGFDTPEEGYLAKILVPAGTTDIPIGQLIAIIVQDEKDIEAFKDFVQTNGTPSVTHENVSRNTSIVASIASELSNIQKYSAETITSNPSNPASNSASNPASNPASNSASSPTASKEMIFITPLARKLATEKGISLKNLKGTGLYGGITSKDLETLKSINSNPTVNLARKSISNSTEKSVKDSTEKSAAKPAEQPTSSFVDIPVSRIRAVIAKRLLESKLTIPHYYVSIEINMDAVLAMRVKLNKLLEKDKIRLTVNDIIVKATAMTCKRVPEGNTAWLGNAIRQYENVDVSVAVSLNGGLITPIVFNANTKGIIQINKEIKALVTKAKEGKLTLQEYQGGTITVSNLGMFGITQFTAVINPPQSIILAVGTTERKLIPADNEKGFKVIQNMSAVISCDHRTVDGALGARWISSFKDIMENPTIMLL